VGSDSDDSETGEICLRDSERTGNGNDANGVFCCCGN